MSLAAGALNQRVLIQERVQNQDSETGDIEEGWVDLAEVWANIAPLSAREFISGDAVQSKVIARITIRYRGDVEPSMRITHRGRVYNIEGVLADKDSGLEYLTLPCSAGVNLG